MQVAMSNTEKYMFGNVAISFKINNCKKVISSADLKEDKNMEKEQKRETNPINRGEKSYSRLDVGLHLFRFV